MHPDNNRPVTRLGDNQRHVTFTDVKSVVLGLENVSCTVFFIVQPDYFERNLSSRSMCSFFVL